MEITGSHYFKRAEVTMAAANKLRPKLFKIDMIIIMLPYKMPNSGVNSGRLKLGNHVIKSSLAVSLSDIKILIKLSFVCFFLYELLMV